MIKYNLENGGFIDIPFATYIEMSDDDFINLNSGDYSYGIFHVYDDENRSSIEIDTDFLED